MSRMWNQGCTGKRFCRECGSELAEGVKFCSNCGASVVINKEQVEDQTPSRNTEATAPKIKSPDLSKLSETTTRLSDAGQRVKASAQKAFSTSKTSQPKKKPLTVLAAVVVVILLISLITNIGGSKNKPENESSSSNVLTANKVFDEITPLFLPPQQSNLERIRIYGRCLECLHCKSGFKQCNQS